MEFCLHAQFLLFNNVLPTKKKNSTLTKIEEHAFEGCRPSSWLSSVTQIVPPPTLTKIGEYPFVGRNHEKEWGKP